MPKTPEETFAEVCSNSVNPMGFRPELFAKAMARQHRTLQQGFTRLCFAWIQHLASLKRDEYDLRNEASVVAAKKIVASVDNLYLPLV